MLCSCSWERAAGQPVDDVDADIDPALPQFVVAGQKVGVAVAAVDPLAGGVVDGLQPQLHLQIGAAGKLAEVIRDLVADAVGAGGNGKPHRVGEAERLLKLFPQHRQRRIGVGVRLEIGDVAGARPLAVHHLPHLLKLVAQRQIFVAGKVPAAFSRAVGAAADTLRAVDVGAGEARVQRDLGDLAAKAVPQKVIEGVVALVGIRIGERIVHGYLSSAPASSSTKMVTSGCRRRMLAGTFGVMGP